MGWIAWGVFGMRRTAAHFDAFQKETRPLTPKATFPRQDSAPFPLVFRPQGEQSPAGTLVTATEAQLVASRGLEMPTRVKGSPSQRPETVIRAEELPSQALVGAIPAQLYASQTFEITIRAEVLPSQALVEAIPARLFASQASERVIPPQQSPSQTLLPSNGDEHPLPVGRDTHPGAGEDLYPRLRATRDGHPCWFQRVWKPISAGKTLFPTSPIPAPVRVLGSAKLFPHFGGSRGVSQE